MNIVVRVKKKDVIRCPDQYVQAALSQLEEINNKTIRELSSSPGQIRFLRSSSRLRG